MSSWVLLYFMAYGQGAALHTIPNLKSLVECERVAEVVKSTYGPPYFGNRRVHYRCIEVFNK